MAARTEKLASLLAPLTSFFDAHPTARPYIGYTAAIALGATTSYVIWELRTKALQDVLMWGVFLYALIRYRTTLRAWRSPAGIAAACAVLYLLLQLPFSFDASLAGRHVSKHIDFAAGALAIPLLFNTRRRIWLALLSVAAAITVACSIDLARHLGSFGWAARQHARYFEPYLMGHPNSAAMVAALGAIILLCAAVRFRRHLSVALPSLLGGVLLLTYQVVMASRGAQLSLLAAAACTALCAMRGIRRKAIALITVAAIAGGTVALNPRFVDRAAKGWLMDRDKVWRHTVQLVSGRPVVGHGYGDKLFMQAYHTNDAPRSAHRFHHPHNYWLHTLFAGGAIGLLLHMAVWISSLVALRVALTRSPGKHARLLPALLLGSIALFHVFGVMDSPTGVITIMMAWTVPATIALAACDRTEARP